MEEPPFLRRLLAQLQFFVDVGNQRLVHARVQELLAIREMLFAHSAERPISVLVVVGPSAGQEMHGLAPRV